MKDEFEKKHSEFTHLNEKSAELTALNVAHGEDSVVSINSRWLDVHERFQYLQKGTKEKILPESKYVSVSYYLIEILLVYYFL